ncbi:MAG: LamG-like jellyroll fold domain-containing protein [Pirellulaceae bacterium]
MQKSNSSNHDHSPSLLKQFFRLFNSVRSPSAQPLDVHILEDRILYSATPLPVDAVDALAGVDQELAELEEQLQAAMVHDPSAPDMGEGNVVPRSAVFLDSSLEDLELLLSQYAENESTDVHVIESTVDGVAFITETLRESSAWYSDVHLVTHGSAGQIQLGSLLLSVENLASYQSQLAGWGVYLTEDADILFYGCDVAQSLEGQELLTAIATWTGADVAASDDLTGHASLGGDWILEYAVGDVTTDVLFGYSVQTSWNHLLDLTAASGETLVHTSTPENQLTTPYGGGNVAMDDSGNYAVVWEDRRSGNADTYAKVYNADGSVRVAEFRVHAVNSSAQDWSNVAMADNGNFVVTWSDNRSGTYETYMRLFDIDGTALTGETLVSQGTGAEDGHAVDFAADGSFVVTWQRAGTNSGDIYFQRYNASGVAQGGNTVANTTTTNTQNHPDVAVNDDGTFVISWMSNAQDGSGYGMYAQRFTAAGAKVGGEIQLAQTTLNNQWYGTIDNDSSGNFVATWMNSDGNGEGIFARRFSSSGTALGNEFQVNTWTSGDQGSPNVSVDDDGDFVITWHDASGHDGTGFGVYAQQYDSSGNAVGGETQIAQTTGNDQKDPTVAIHGTSAVIVWGGNGSQSGQTDSSGVFMRQYTLSGVGPALANVVPGSQSTNEDTSLIFSSGNGNQISITDDPGTSLEVILSITNGTLTLSGTSGLTFSTGDGTSDATMTFSGTVENINTALNGLSFNPTANYYGGATLTIDTSEGSSALDVDAALDGRYTFDNTGALGTDDSGSGNNGTVVGATAFNDPTRGQVLSFDGNDYVQISGHFGNPANLTLAAWVNLTTADSGGSEVISIGDSAILRVDAPGKLEGVFYNGSTWTITSYNVTLAGAGWHHVAYSFNDAGNNAKLYLDGVEVASTSTFSSINYSLGANTFIGKHGNGGSTWDFTGLIDDARIYTRALSAAEVAELATTGTPETDTDNVAITVNAVNDAPVNSLPANRYTAMNTALTFSSGNGNALQISDVDAGSNNVSVTLTQTHGTLTLASTTGLTLTSGANGTSSMTYTGTVSAINTALNVGLTFTPTTNDRALAELTIQTSDLGNSGSGGTLTDTDVIKIHVGALVVTNSTDTSNGTVTSISNLIANDGGDGISLREAIAATNATAGADTIIFEIGSGTQTISLAAALPNITGTVIIDAWTQPGFSGTPRIIIDANGVTGDGFQLTSTADNSTIRGFVIRDFVGDGIQINSGSTGNTIEGNYIGSFSWTGTDSGVGEQNTGYGIYVLGSGNTIGGTTAQSRNVIGGNQLSGVYISGAGATNNTLLGNYIGVDATGGAVTANDYGIYVTDTTGTIIGNGTAAGRNVIAGNTNQGILLWNASSTTIQGNYIGTNATGTADLNGAAQEGAKSGIVVGGTTSNVMVGGTVSGQGNLISGNNWFGIEFWSGTTNSYVYGNYIGTDVTGLLDLGNSMGGVTMWGSGTGIVVGGGTSAHRNIISGNDWVGVSMGNAAAATTIQGNYIGLGADGSTVIGNQAGVVVEGGSAGSLIGTNWDGSNDSGERNVISGNQWGLMIQGSGTSGTMVWGNYIGTDATGLLDRGNTSDGILIQNGATGTQIGGTGTKRNVISGNDGDGIQIDGEATDGTFIQNNYIGLAANGITVLGNAATGINITGGADNTTIGGGSGLGNVIVGSGYNGIQINGASSGTTITGNYIGINAAGTVVAGNQMHGIQLINGVSNTTIGGTLAGQGNIITANGVGGTYVNGINIYASGTGNSIIGNSIYGNVGIGIDLDSDGVTANDNLDPDSGSNNQQNFPVLSSSTVNAGGTTVTVSGTINTLASLTGVVIHFYATPVAGDVNKREGKRYLGSTTVNTDASGNATFTNVALSGYSGTVAAGELISATATYSNNTSEFSQGAIATLSTGNSAPSNLEAVSTTGGGLQINSDGGNDTILVADNGGGVFGGLTQMTIETQLAFTNGSADMTLLSYGVGGTNVGNDVNVRLYGDGSLRFYINGTYVSANSFNYSSLADGQQHSLAITWSNTAGAWQVYVDGTLRDSGTGLKVGATVQSGGTLAFGNDQDRQGNSYDPNQKFSGTLYDARVFNDVRTAAEIAANYARDLQYTESGLLANWKFDELSTAGVITDEVSGNNLTVNHLTGSGFVSSSPMLTYSIIENASSGSVVGSVTGIDIDREARITSLLAADPTLRYSAETGKFYKLVTAGTTWATALTNATTTTLSGISGSMVRIDNAAENAFLFDQIEGGGLQYWIGASDSLVEGQWSWYDGTSASDTFWSGAVSGNRVNDLYNNWNSATQPNDAGGAEDAARFDPTDGRWYDAPEGSSYGYIVQWSADDVLDATNAVTYSIQSQTVAGAFTINSDTGEITVADSSKLNYEASAAHTLTVRVTDGSGAFYDEAFTVTIEDLDEVTQTIPLTTQTLNEDSSKVFSSANGNAITVSYEAATNDRLQVYLQVNNGTLTLSQTTGLSILGGANGSSFMTLQGTESDLNAALNGLTYTPTANYNGADTLTVTTSLDADLQGYYTFEGGNAIDQSVGISQNGTLVGNATTVTDPERGEVLSLDGTGDYVQVSGHFGNPADVTLAAWVNLTSRDSYGAEVISLGDSVVLRVDDITNGLNAIFYDGSSWNEVSFNTTLAGTGWHHVALTFDDTANTAKLYLDGSVVASATISSSISYSLGSNTFIGRHGNGNTDFDFNGQIDDARIYTRALSASEIAALANDQTNVTGDVAITVNAVNDAPTLSLGVGGGTYYENATGVYIDTLATVTDADEVDFDGGVLTTWVSNNGTADDVLFVRHEGAGAGQVNVSGSDILIDGVTIGSFTGGNGDADPLLVTFNANADAADVEKVVRRISFRVDSEDPSGLQRTISMQVTDGDGGTSAIDTRSENVLPINDAPSGADNTITINEDATYTFTAADFGFSDIDNDAFNRVWIMTLPGAGQLKFNGSTFAANNWILKSDIDLGLLTYEPATNANGIGYATFDFQVQDNGGTTNGGVNRDPTSNTITLDVTAQNDAPTASHGGAYAINEGDSLNLDASGSTDVDGDTLTYRWDLDNDGQYDDLVTSNATEAVAWSTLYGLGVDDDGVYTIGLQVDDGNGGLVASSTTVTIANVGPTLTASGAATAGGDQTYTLTLTDVDPGNDTISSWIVNWGDGSIDTYVGDPSSVTHVYSNDLSGLTFNIAVSAIDEDGQYFEANLLAPAYGGDYVNEYDGFGGTFVGSFAPSSDGILGHANIVFMPNGNYLVSGVDSGNIVEYQPDGTRVGDFVAASDTHLNNPGGMAYGPDGNLYVADYGGGKIVRFDGTTGGYIDDFVASGLTNPLGLEFGPDGNLYVANRGSAGVLRYDGITGALDAGFNVAGISGAEDLTFGPDGNIYVGSASGVIRVNATTGATSTFIANGAGGLQLAAGVEFGPDGNLYVADQDANVIRRYNGTTGAYIDNYATGIGGPAYLEFTADHQVTISNSNQSPTIATNTGDTVLEGSLGNVITTAMLNEGDPDDSGAELTYTVTANVANGTLRLNGAVIGLNDTFTQADIDAGLVTYDHDGSETTTDSFGFSLADGGENGSTPATGTFNFTVTSVNDAPVLSPYTPTFATNEDAAATTMAVSTILGTSVTDADAAASEGVAIYGLTGSVGAFEYSLNGGSTWTTISGVTSSNALLLRATDLIRFTPDGQNGGVSTLTYYAWDQTSGSAGGTADVTTRGGTTAFSSTGDLVTINSAAINDAPVLDNTGNMTLASVAQNSSGNGGSTVANILDSTGVSRVVDVDSGASRGIAVYATDTANGTWQYSIDGGNNWLDFGSPTLSSARLLDANALVRFEPNTDFTGTATISFKAWDQTSGTNGGTADATTGGGRRPSAPTPSRQPSPLRSTNPPYY